jgi:hypothetical protein
LLPIRPREAGGIATVAGPLFRLQAVEAARRRQFASGDGVTKNVACGASERSPAAQLRSGRMDLQYSRIDDLMTLIKDSFRVRPNVDPVYVDGEGGRGDVAESLARAAFHLGR